MSNEVDSTDIPDSPESDHKSFISGLADKIIGRHDAATNPAALSTPASPKEESPVVKRLRRAASQVKALTTAGSGWVDRALVMIDGASPQLPDDLVAFAQQFASARAQYGGTFHKPSFSDLEMLRHLSEAAEKIYRDFGIKHDDGSRVNDGATREKKNLLVF